jgi:hypothetical protein
MGKSKACPEGTAETISAIHVAQALHAPTGRAIAERRVGTQAVGVFGTFDASATDWVAHLSDAAIVRDLTLDAHHPLLVAVACPGRARTLPRARRDTTVNGLPNANFVKVAIALDVAFHAAVQRGIASRKGHVDALAAIEAWHAMPERLARRHQAVKPCLRALALALAASLPLRRAAVGRRATVALHANICALPEAPIVIEAPFLGSATDGYDRSEWPTIPSAHGAHGPPARIASASLRAYPEG